MGEIGAFLKIHRSGIPYKDAVERVEVEPFREFLVQRSDEELSAQGARCMECGVPFCHNGCPLGQPDPGLERPRLSRRLGAGDRPAARDEQLPRVHRPPVPGAVRGLVRARDQRGRRRLDQADRELDHRPRLGRGLRDGAAAGLGDRPQRRGRRLGPGRAWPRRSSCAAPAIASSCSSATRPPAGSCASACRTSRSRSGSSSGACSSSWTRASSCAAASTSAST